MAASSAAAPSKLTQNFDRAREEYARAQEIMVERAMELERMQKELNAAQREVCREVAMGRALIALAISEPISEPIKEQ